MPGKLDPAFRGRFSYVASLDYYSEAALGTIIERAAAKRGLVLAEGAALTLGERSRGTPRTALHLLTQAADYAVVTEEPEITPDVVLDSLALHGIDGVRRPTSVLAASPRSRARRWRRVAD